MSAHPPPAPDWILGDDGHWKPPPFDAGRPSGPPPSAPPPPTMPPQAPWPAPGGPGPGGPPPSGPSTGRVVAIVLGSLAVAGFAGLALLIGAVTFLGTTSESELRQVGGPVVDPIDDPASSSGRGSDDVTASEITMAAVADELTQGDWTVTGGEAPEVGDVSGTCAPEGWLTGAADRFRAYFGRPSDGSTGTLTVSITTYVDAASAQAELERARSQAYRDCEVVQHGEEFAAAAVVTPLPDDPTAPGVAYQVDETGGVARTEVDITVVIGVHRAHLDFCGCADLSVDDQRAVARQVAAAVAGDQGLPVPG